VTIGFALSSKAIDIHAGLTGYDESSISESLIKFAQTRPNFPYLSTIFIRQSVTAMIRTFVLVHKVLITSDQLIQAAVLKLTHATITHGSFFSKTGSTKHSHAIETQIVAKDIVKVRIIFFIFIIR
jgi:hypothetical protein